MKFKIYKNKNIFIFKDAGIGGKINFENYHQRNQDGSHV